MKKNVALVIGLTMLISTFSLPVMADDKGVSEEQSDKISSQCSIIKDNLRNVQHEDARIFTFLYGYYGNILTGFMMPLNVALVANNITDVSLVENQSDFTDVKAKFYSDYIVYQKSLEDLVAINCKKEPVKFYEKLINVRKERRSVASDVLKMQNLMTTQVNLVTKLENSL